LPSGLPTKTPSFVFKLFIYDFSYTCICL
jgi:hypothetical protein